MNDPWKIPTRLICPARGNSLMWMVYDGLWMGWMNGMHGISRAIKPQVTMNTPKKHCLVLAEMDGCGWWLDGGHWQWLDWGYPRYRGICNSVQLQTPRLRLYLEWFLGLYFQLFSEGIWITWDQRLDVIHINWSHGKGSSWSGLGPALILDILKTGWSFFQLGVRNSTISVLETDDQPSP